jgi:UDP-N-acetylmuramoylalanine--D-glutamate ligase
MPVVRTAEVPLPGAHNLLNVMPSIVVGRLFGVEPATIATAIRSLTALPHRMHLVHQWRGRDFYNDSLSTVPEAAMAALSALPDRPIVLLAGGHDRGQTWSDLAAAIVRSSVTAVVLLPRGDRALLAAIEQAAREAGTPVPKLSAADTMPDAVRCAIEASEPGSAVLLSPAAASFGAFRDYEDRGNQFRAAAVALCEAADAHVT